MHAMKIKTLNLLIVILLAGSLAPLARPAQPAAARGLQPSDGQTTYYLPEMFLNYSSSSYGAVSGVIVDAISSQPVGGASVCVSQHCVTSNTQGAFYLANVPNSNPQTLTVNPNDFNYAFYSQQVQTTFSAPLYLVVSLSKNNLPPGWIRIVLSWSVKGDLDAHLWWLPVSQPIKHIYWNFRGDCTAYACLQNDSATFGPETLTVTSGLSGSLSFAVARNGDLEVTQFNALVQVYDSTGLIQSFPAPTTGIGSVWYVFDMAWDTTNPLNPYYAITPQNKLLNGLPH